MKHWIKGLLLVVGVSVGSTAWAQAYCRDGGAAMSSGPMAGLCSDGSPPQAGGGGGGSGTAPVTVIRLPTSYGAVALDSKTGSYGYASKQVSKRASKQAALMDCGTNACKVLHTYSNACVSVAWGAYRNNSGQGAFEVVSREALSNANQEALLRCSDKANDCKIIYSECSLAGQINGR